MGAGGLLSHNCMIEMLATYLHCLLKILIQIFLKESLQNLIASAIAVVAGMNFC
jgi:hypothetical protein